MLGKIRLFLLGAALVGPVLVYFGWSDVQRIRDVETNGIEATARIEGATRTKGGRGSETYALQLAWQDQKGAVRKDESVTISHTFARQIVSDDKIMRQSLRIKYLPDTIDAKPIVLEDSGRQEEQHELMMNIGLGLTGAGAVGSGLLFLVGRRRRNDAVSPQA